MNLNEWRDNAYAVAKNKGWHEQDGVDPFPLWAAAQLALIHSEVSEALEDVRDDNTTISYDSKGKPVGLPIELADILLRVFDLCGAMKVDLDQAVKIKHGYNQLRPVRHGGKLL